MPEPPKRQCGGGCGRTVERGRCTHCTPTGASTGGRLSPSKRGYGPRWQKARKAYLAAHPECVDPFSRHRGLTVLAEHLDHIVPHRGDMKLFWDFDGNVQPLCPSCHSIKTLNEGSFGRWSGSKTLNG